MTNNFIYSILIELCYRVEAESYLILQGLSGNGFAKKIIFADKCEGITLATNRSPRYLKSHLLINTQRRWFFIYIGFDTHGSVVIYSLEIIPTDNVFGK